MRVAGRPLERGAARAAIVAAADRLFYERGVATTSLEAVAESAGVTRRTLYYHFASKDVLVGEYLRARDMRSRALVTSAGTVLGVFDRLEGLIRRSDFKGCALTNAALGEAETVVFAGAITMRHKRALRTWFIAACVSLDARSPTDLGEALMLIFDGCLVASRTRRDRAYIEAARRAVRTLLAAHGVSDPS